MRETAVTATIAASTRKKKRVILIEHSCVFNSSGWFLLLTCTSKTLAIGQQQPIFLSSESEMPLQQNRE